MTDSPVGRRLRAGIVGGGRGSFIGPIHRIAAEMDGEALIVAGAMSSDSHVADASAQAWYLNRSYGSFAQMAAAEAARSDGIDFVIVATPNHLHYPVARAFLEAGIHVICDKPLALTLAEAESLDALVSRGVPLFALTFNYTGYAAVREARELIRLGRLGALRKILVEYNQSWLMQPIEHSGSKQAAWRTDPIKAGIGGCVGDIGSHAHNLVEFVTGQHIAAVCADLTSFVPGRELDDDANMLIRLAGGAKGTLICSQVACGEDNALTLRIYGEQGGLEWRQQEPSLLIYKPASQPWQTLRAGSAYLNEPARAAGRLPAGHPEGYLEAFAVIYREFMADVRRAFHGESVRGDYPTARDGLRGMRFVTKAVESSRNKSEWTTL